MKIYQNGTFVVGVNKGVANIDVVSKEEKDIANENSPNKQNSSFSQERKKKFIELVFAHWFWILFSAIGAIASIYALFK